MGYEIDEAEVAYWGRCPIVWPRPERHPAPTTGAHAEPAEDRTQRADDPVNGPEENPLD